MRSNLEYRQRGPRQTSSYPGKCRAEVTDIPLRSSERSVVLIVIIMTKEFPNIDMTGDSNPWGVWNWIGRVTNSFAQCFDGRCFVDRSRHHRQRCPPIGRRLTSENQARLRHSRQDGPSTGRAAIDALYIPSRTLGFGGRISKSTDSSWISNTHPATVTIAGELISPCRSSTDTPSIS